MSKIKLGLISLVCLSALSSNAKSAVTFYNTPTWEKPRVALNNVYLSESDYSSMNPGNYSFRTTLKESDGIESNTTLLGEVIGPQNSSNYWDSINLQPNTTSLRSWSDNLTTPGNYNLKFTLKDGSSIQRDFTIIPEPTAFSLLALATLPFFKKRK